jgi:hypothetical protein
MVIRVINWRTGAKVPQHEGRAGGMALVPRVGFGEEPGTVRSGLGEATGEGLADGDGVGGGPVWLPR